MYLSQNSKNKIKTIGMYTVKTLDYILSCYDRLSPSAPLIEDQIMKQSILATVGGKFFNCKCQSSDTDIVFSLYYSQILEQIK